MYRLTCAATVFTSYVLPIYDPEMCMWHCKDVDGVPFNVVDPGGASFVLTGPF